MMALRTRCLQNMLESWGFNEGFRTCSVFSNVLHSRSLHIHEFQSVEMLNKYGVPVPKGTVIHNLEEINKALNTVTPPYVVKAQILAGGRGLGHFKENGFAGGVHICRNADELNAVATLMLNNTLVTKQTGPTGKPVDKLYICQQVPIKRECYIALLVDRQSAGPLFIGSAIGGTSIEEIALKNPDAIVKMPIGIGSGLVRSECESFCEGLGLHRGDSNFESCISILSNMLNLFYKTDCTLLEINPFVELTNGQLVACDAKLNFDDNAAFRQREIFSLADPSQDDEGDIIAKRYDLNYVALNGNIGCMVNGAGLAMATMDIIRLHGGNAANFLDLGGNAKETQVEEALRILQSNKSVKSILVNIFGGIMRCDIISTGIVNAVNRIGLIKPIVIRLEGTNKDEAKGIFEKCGHNLSFCNDFNEAARRAVELAAAKQ